ncbi:MAG: RdgB/HAM1 family non-canonical purine NTP pyrophosphatase [Rikenellaceae bacterium]
MKIVFATNNAHKLEEVQQMLSSHTIVSLREQEIVEEIPETAPTLEGNALMKARYIYDNYTINCFADDTGLEVDALNGEPGVRSARYASPQGGNTKANNELLLKNLNGVEQRTARFRTIIALIINGREHLFEGVVEGRISTDYSGSEGFGYDPLFIPNDGDGRSFAEMSMDEKGAISHRGRAVTKLVEFLNQNYGEI